MMDLELELNILLRAFIALVLCGLLGWERESAGKSAGVRTHMLVGLASALFVSMVELLVARFSAYGQLMRFDPTRVLEAVVTGVSFLCAGIVFVARGGQRVRGLTTAAAIPVTAAVGMVVGLQHYLLAVGVTAMTFLILYALGKFTDKHGPQVGKSNSR